MDVLDDWLRVLGAEGSVLVRGKLSERGGVRVPARDDVMFHIVTQGNCVLRPPGGTRIQLSEGGMVLVPQGLAHDLIDDPQGTSEPPESHLAERQASSLKPSPTTFVSGLYKADQGLAVPMFRSLPPVVNLAASRVRANPGFALTIAQLVKELDEPGPGSEGLVRHLLDVLFVYVNREWSLEAAVGGFSYLAALRDAPLSRALGRMHSAPAAPWTVETLANAAVMPRSTFARQFMLHMGEPPLGYLTRWRMILAARLLSEGGTPVAEVANKVGYDSEFAFSRAFKRQRGVAPTAFRRGAIALAVAEASEPEMATEMAPDADRDYVSVFDASGVGRSRPSTGSA